MWFREVQMSTPDTSPQHSIEFRVFDEGELTLHYRLSSMSEAIEVFQFIGEFFPNARFVIQPSLN